MEVGRLRNQLRLYSINATSVLLAARLLERDTWASTLATIRSSAFIRRDKSRNKTSADAKYSKIVKTAILLFHHVPWPRMALKCSQYLFMSEPGFLTFQIHGLSSHDPCKHCRVRYLQKVSSHRTDGPTLQHFPRLTQTQLLQAPFVLEGTVV